MTELSYIHYITIKSKWEEIIVESHCSLFLKFEFSRSSLFLHFNLKDCVFCKVSAYLFMSRDYFGQSNWLGYALTLHLTQFLRLKCKNRGRAGKFKLLFTHILRVTTSDNMLFQFKINCNYKVLYFWYPIRYRVIQTLTEKLSHILIWVKVAKL